MSRILTIALFLGFSGGFSVANAEQLQTSVDCQYSCSCQACCAQRGINCNPPRDLNPIANIAPVSAPSNTGDAAIAN